ncbi:MAG: primosome assembly protein PriA, partial [Actinomycetes bacterium]
VQALVRWDPATFADRELADREALGFPPAVRMASLTGPAAAVADLLAVADLPAAAEVLGPVEVPPPTGRTTDASVERALVRVPRNQGGALAEALHAAQADRSARKAAQHVRVQVDPLEIA